MESIHVLGDCGHHCEACYEVWPCSASTASLPTSQSRDQLHKRFMAMLKEQDYGYPNAQPSRRGMAYVILNNVWPDLGHIETLRAQIAIIIRDHQVHGDTAKVHADLVRMLDLDPEIRTYLERMGGGK